MLPLSVGIRNYLSVRNNRTPEPVVESDVALTLAVQDAERRFECSWQALNRHDPHAVDPSRVVLTPEKRLLEHHLARDLDPWKWKVRLSPDPHKSELDNAVS